MNYRHAFHAGGFQDVVKHAALALLIELLKAKDKPLFLLDTHAGAGRYDLNGVEAQRTREYESGIARVLDASARHGGLAAYLGIVRAMNRSSAETRWYPGSPAIARAMLRAQDRMVFVESVPEIAGKLAGGIAGDDRVRVETMDGYVALKALLPPVERRGLILIDPPFEIADEFERLVAGVKAAYRRFATGVYLIWYPIKDDGEVARFRQALAATGIAKLIEARLIVDPHRAEGLRGCGLIVINPPWRFTEQFAELLEILARVLAPETGRARVGTLAAETTA